MKLTKYLLPVFLLASISATAQTTYVPTPSARRLEIPVPANTDNFFTIPVRENGVLLLTQAGKSGYNLVRFDTNLDRVWQVEGTISDNLDYVNYSYDGKDVYLLFSKFRSNRYQVIKVYVGPGFTEKFDIYSVDKLEISEFKAHRDGVYIAGVVREQPVLLYTNLQTRQSKLLPSAMKGSAEIQTIDIDSVNHRVNVTYSVRKGKTYELVVKSFDEDGRQDSQVLLEPEEDFALLNGKLSPLTDTTQLMIGTYGYRSMQSTTRGPVSQGVYMSQITPAEVLPTRYYSFTDFKNFFNFLSPREQERKERQIARQKERGGDLKLNYQLLVHDLIPNGDQYVLVAEAFQPTFRYQNNNPYGGGFGGSPFFGSPYGGLYSPYGWGWGLWSMNPWYGGSRSFWGNNQQVFDGWQYTHAVVAGFDKKGTLLWDNSFEIDNVKTMKLKEKVRTSIREGQVALFYSNQGAIRSKVVKGNLVVEGEAEKTFSTVKEGDKIRRNTNDDLEYWYDNYFLAWGYQRIQNEAEGRRNVFYLNKIAF
ncbi:MAG: hypothetical protein H7Y12_06005 [Sphingobacteriaceae bacterium]|nr:hypothetical protein [Cytophagaceae bacterium]